MRCVKCGVVQTNINLDRLSCRIHDTDVKERCEKCPGRGNCYHEWVYFHTFWHAVRIFKLFFIRKLTRKPYDDEYVEL